MNYHLKREGQELGSFPLDELRRRREAGELTGTEQVRCEGMSAWESLEAVLQGRPDQRPAPTPLPLPAKASRRRMNWKLIAAVLIGGILIEAAIVFVTFRNAVPKPPPLPLKPRRGPHPQVLAEAASQAAFDAMWQTRTNSMEGVAEASKPVLAGTNSMTVEEARKRAQEFRVRQWLEGYKERGQRDQPCDAKAERFIEVWLAHSYDSAQSTNKPFLEKLGHELVADPACNDPLVLAGVGLNSIEFHESVRLLERALSGFEPSRHRAYPKLIATVVLADALGEKTDRAAALDLSAVKLLKECFTDGSFLPRDEAEIAEIFVNGWGAKFFKRRGGQVHAVPAEFGKSFPWLALMLEGEFQVNEAWRMRGGDWASKVSAEGWQGFSEHLALAREALTEAWKLRPELPLAPARMITVAMGDTGAGEMRLWFDRATMAQIDYLPAWTNLRWGLYPRWHGSLKALMAMGVTAIKTERFDSRAPWDLINAVTDLEKEYSLRRGQFLYGRGDIWPQLQRMFEGFLGVHCQAGDCRLWHSFYAAMAYQVGRLDVTRSQLEAVNWDPTPARFLTWDRDLSLLPLEVAARTGGLGKQVEAAEASRAGHDFAGARKLYREVEASPKADERTRAYARQRLAAFTIEEPLSRSDWISFLPAMGADSNWIMERGKSWRLVDGALEVEAGAEGHLLRCRVPIGDVIEVKGEFEVVRSSTKDFQVGLVMGVADYENPNWYGFRLKRNADEGDLVCISAHWGNERFHHHLKLNDDRNSFRMVLQGQIMSAWVNDQPVCQSFRLPVFINSPIPKGQFYLGLGAYNDLNETVVRYRNLQLRSLLPPQ